MCHRHLPCASAICCALAMREYVTPAFPLVRLTQWMSDTTYSARCGCPVAEGRGNLVA